MPEQVLARAATSPHGQHEHPLLPVSLRDLWERVTPFIESAEGPDTNRTSILRPLRALTDVSLRPGEDTVYVARYKFGEPILDAGRFVPPRSCTCQACLQAGRLIGEGVPLLLILAGSAEVHVESRDLLIVDQQETTKGRRSAPLRIVRAGEWLGLFETLDRVQHLNSDAGPWSVTAGPRSLVLLHDFRSKASLSAFGYRGHIPPAQDPFFLIRHLMNDVLKSPWRATLLIIPHTVIPTDATEVWLSLHEMGWVQSAHLRMSGLEDELMQHIVVTGGSAKKWRGTAQATVRHLVKIARGLLPAFRPASSSDLADAPLREVMDLLADDTAAWREHIRYAPVILQPDLLSPGGVGFYSFRRPSIPVAIALASAGDLTEFFVETVQDPLYKLNGQWQEEAGSNPTLRRQFSREMRSLRIYRHSAASGLDRKLTFSIDELPASELGAKDAQLFTNHSWLSAVARIERV